MEWPFVLIGLLSFGCMFVDASLGMGYGTTLIPILILMGYKQPEIVPALLLSQLAAGVVASFCHHKFQNANFHYKSKDTHVALVLAAFALIGTSIGVALAVKLPEHVVTILIGAIVMSMGVLILVTMNHRPRFTWRRIMMLGTVASFNKGMSGGGYGPVVMGGQILSGIGVKNAVGITALSESITCVIAVFGYYLARHNIYWTLTLWLTIGAVLSAPLSAHFVSRITEKRVTYFVAIATLILGAALLWKAIF